MSTPLDAGAWPSGFCIHPRQTTLTAELLKTYQHVPVAHAGDVMGRHTGAVGLRAYHNDLGLTMCGTAMTVRTRPGDNLMVHVAMQRAQPGDIIVIDAGGDLSTAVIGGLMRTTAVARQLGGFVIDGVLRDVAEWAEGELPVYARGHVHRGPSKDGPGQINIPISCAGMTVMPGDLILGDADGVIAIPAGEAEAILAQCLAHADKEARIRAQNETGEVDRERFDSILRKKGCPL